MNLLELNDDAQLLWVGFHAIWLLWGDPRLRGILEREPFTGRDAMLTRIRVAGHLDFVEGASTTAAALDGLALASLDEDPAVSDAVDDHVERTLGSRPGATFARMNAPGKRWARWLVRRFEPQFGATGVELEARTTRAVHTLLAFGAARRPREPDALSHARVEALYRAAFNRPTLAAGPVEGLALYAEAGSAVGRHALGRIARVATRESTGHLLRALSSRSSVLRSQAAWAVSPSNTNGRVSPPAIVKRLFALLADEDPEVRSQAMLTLVETVGVGVYLPRLKVLAREIRRTPAHTLAVDLDEAITQVRLSDLTCRGFPERLGLPS
jgi:hypothetical protein